MKIICSQLFLLCLVLPFSLATAGDRFDELKKELSSANCSHFDFISITESEVFESVDSTVGSAWIARDGRYRVDLGADIYLFDGNKLFSYSSENKQVVIEKVDADQSSIGAEVSFVIHLDEYYQSTVVQAGREYALVKRSEEQTNIPDSLRLFLNDSSGFLERLIYFNENGDRQQIVMNSRELFSACDSEIFEAIWPEGTESVKLY